MNKGRFAIGALIGAAAGVVAGLLTAPKSGRETRADLQTKAMELKEEAARRSQGATKGSGSLSSNIKKRVGNLKNKGSSGGNDATDIVEDLRKPKK